MFFALENEQLSVLMKAKKSLLSSGIPVAVSNVQTMTILTLTWYGVPVQRS
jgi:hypothetical protein